MRADAFLYDDKNQSMSGLPTCFDSNLLATSHRSVSWASGRDCNQGGEVFDRWLEQTGGRRLVRRGESDARTDHDALEPWMETLWAALCT